MVKISETHLESRLKELIELEVSKAISITEGVRLSKAVLERSDNESAVEIFFLNHIIDVTVNVDVNYGIIITDLSCNLQEKIKSLIEKNTKFNLRKINIIVHDIVL